MSDEPRAGRSRANIDDVAQAAGVSTATVSRALRGHPYVAEATRQRILRIADDLHYVANANAARLASGQSRTIGLLAPLLTSWYTSEIVAGVEEVLTQAQYDLLIGTANAVARERIFRGDARFQQRIDGVILVDVFCSEEGAQQLSQSEAPVVVLGEQLRSVTSVSVDNAFGARLAARHLIDLGHRRVGVVGGHANLDVAHNVPTERLDGFRDTLAAAGLELSSVDRGRRHQMIAVVAGYRGDLELAKREFAQVLAVCEQACPATHTTALSNLAVIAIREGDYEEALRLRQRAVDRAIEHDGADSVATAILRLGLAEALVETGQNEAAREEGMRARAVIERHEGPKQPELMREALVQYRVADAFGDKAGMVEHARRAVAIAEAVTAPDAPRRAIYYGTLGSALHVAGDYPGAERAFDQAFALLDDSDDGFQRAQLLIARGLMRIDAGDAARGLQDNRDARAIERARAHPDLQRITYTYGNEARALANLGDRTGAVEALEAGVAAFE
ncbi:MAG TPA: LacI family DNA-binding transcriptional regulator, partial [Ilumatobacteraceae bacterium]|nr:LacI family DNA-binding transcriptional regulator [Ilumatobacteraceae bacterium]